MPLVLKGRRKCPDMFFHRQPSDAPPGKLPEQGTATMDGVPHTIHHSPTGIEWGYGGSGPADAALSILAYCLPVGCDGQPHVNLYRGSCSQLAWDLHQRFKWEFIATLPHEGEKVFGREVDLWIDEQLATLDGADREGAADGEA